MASPGQRIQQSYVSGAGASGGLLACAMIGFICLVGLVSFSSWPQPSGSPASLLDLNLAPARAPQPAKPNQAPAHTAVTATPVTPAVPTGVVTGTRARPGPGAAKERGSHKGGSHSGGRVHVTPVPPTSTGAERETGSAPGNSGNAPGHTKRTDSRTASAAQEQGHGNGHAFGRRNGSEDRGHGNGRGNGNGNGHDHGHAHGGGPESD